MLANIALDAWRMLVVLSGILMVCALIRVFMERLGRLPPRIEREGKGDPVLGLVNIGGTLYIVLDIILNFGQESITWNEAPLGTLVVFLGAATLMKKMRS